MPVVVSEAWTSVTPSTRGKLVEKVVRLYGMDAANTRFNQLALDSLDETVNDMNCACYEFNRVAESGIVMTAGDQNVILSTNFFKESQAYLVDNTAGDQAPLTYLPYVHFKRLYPNNITQGTPMVYSIFNFEQEGRVQLCPVPTDQVVDVHTLTIEYYRRIPAISSTGSGGSINVPREVESALVYGAQKRLAITVQGAGHPDVVALQALEAQALERLKRVDKLHPDERMRFRVSDFAGPGGFDATGTLYIKVQ